MTMVHLAILWHQHQPCYVDLLEGTSALPWVRLHAIKDYYGMAAVAEEFPEVRLTVNLVPGMLDQLEAYAEGRLSDPWMACRDVPAADLDAAGREFILDKFFMASWDRMIRPVARYGELLDKRAFGRLEAGRAALRFSSDEIRDLQVLSGLVWFHPLAIERDDRLKGLAAKGRGYTEEDKRDLAAAERELLARVIPLHRELSERSQLEISTTPHYHPILPLLCDMERAREAMPGVRLPERRRSLTEDAREHVRLAVESHERRFGSAPRGMWPSEGSVSPETVELAAGAGIDWLATDEEILSASLGRAVRDGSGRASGELYRPWRAEAGTASVAMVFRDHRLSDAIGFRYQNWDPKKAADDFVAQVREAGGRATGDALVPVILDGENCWEHYPDQGLEFLRGAYGALAKAKDIRTTTVADYVDRHPPSERLPRVFSGSWINHDFYIWIGSREDVRAWEMLYRVREWLGSVAGELDPEKLDAALRSMYAAEGSDWFWWFGDDHSSGMDDEFDRLFRAHLANVYRLAGHEAPDFLEEPVLRVQAAAPGSEPRAFLAVEIDGRPTHYFEWIAAGRASSVGAGSMSRAEAARIEDVWYGFDLERLFLRVDLAGDRMPGPGEGLRAVVIEPHTVTIEIPRAARGEQAGVDLSFEGGGRRSGAGMAAADRCVELYVPFADIGVSAGDVLRFKVELVSEGDVVESLPESGTIPLEVPSEDFEKSHWQV